MGYFQLGVGWGVDFVGCWGIGGVDWCGYWYGVWVVGWLL